VLRIEPKNSKSYVIRKATFGALPPFRVAEEKCHESSKNDLL